jgi:hypothetical protein
MPLVDRLERKHGWIAIPGIVRILAAFQLLVFLLIYLKQGAEFVTVLELDPARIMNGEVWRLVSFAILPATLSPLMMVFILFFMVFLGEILERLWGSFRLTLYVFGGIAGIVAGAFFAYYVIGPVGYYFFYVRSHSTGYLWVTMILLAVAVLQPSLQINIMGVIPVKIMWIGIFDAAIILIDVIQLTRVHFLLGISMLLAISNFLIVFGPSAYRQMRQRGEVALRRREFETAKMPEADSLHCCGSCGKTEHDDPDLEFRVAADGEEYCSEHLPGRSEG